MTDDETGEVLSQIALELETRISLDSLLYRL